MDVEPGSLHHVEVHISDPAADGAALSWLFTELGYVRADQWSTGMSWQLGSIYVVLEQTRHPAQHDRRGSGVNHLAFHAGTRQAVDRLWGEGPRHGWTQLHSDRHPWAGGPEHYAAYLANAGRFKIELVASGT